MSPDEPEALDTVAVTAEPKAQPRWPITNAQLLLGMIAIAIALVMAASSIRDGMESNNERDTIVVVGSSRRPVEADIASWKVSLTSEATTPEIAIRDLERDFAIVETFVRNSDVTWSAISISPVSLRELTKVDGLGNRRTRGFSVTRTLHVRSTDLNAVEQVAESSVELIAEGLPIQSSSIEFVYSKIADDRAEMTAEAGEDARERAAAIAEVGGADLGVVRDVRVGDFQVTSRGGTSFESGGSFDRSSRLKDIVVVVHLTIELE